VWFLAIHLSQFHFIFYMSRPLPNVMALPLVLLAVDSWLRREQKKFFAFAGASILIFRSELVIFLGLLLIYDLFHKRISIPELLKIGVPTGAILVAVTVIVDSYFWQRLLWPEIEVLWYNTIMNKSSEWGTSPFLWYFYSALPRALGLSLFLVPYGLYAEPRIRAITIPAILFVLLYSFLPHKELRFIIYVFPMLNIASACACQRLWINRKKSIFRTLLSFMAIAHLIGNFVLTVFLLTVSKNNYPGGVAISRLHRIASNEVNVTIHIDNLTAQTGVTRFTEIYSNWTYRKDENLKAGDAELHNFNYLLVEVKNKFSPEMRLLAQTHEKIELVECFSNIGVHYASLLPIKIRTKPCIMIMKKKKNGIMLKRYFEPEEESEFESDELLGLEEDNEDDVDNDNENSTNDDDDEEEAVTEAPPKVLKRKRLRSTIMKLKIKEIIEAMKLETMDGQNEDESTEQLSQESTPPPPMVKEEEQQQHLSVESTASDDDDEEAENFEDKEQGSGKTKDSIKKIISQEKTKHFLDELKKLDLSALCDLEQMDTKECLKKILDETETADL
jgi:alpha-1,6-mannosyltransferase